MGTNKTSALRLDLYNSKQDMTTMITVNPHEGRFDNFNHFPRINSKYKNSFKLDLQKTSGRDTVITINTRLIKEKQNSPFTEVKLGNKVGLDKPNAPSQTAFYGMEIPKYYSGQPGFKKANAKEK